jgi:hypothetical protein
MRQVAVLTLQELNETRIEFAELARAVERLGSEWHRAQKRADASQKMLLLEIENRLLRYERGLPPPEVRPMPQEPEEPGGAA